MRHKNTPEYVKERLAKSLDRIVDILPVSVPIKWVYHWTDDQEEEIRVLATAYSLKSRKLAVEGLTLRLSELDQQASQIVKAISLLERHFNKISK